MQSETPGARSIAPVLYIFMGAMGGITLGFVTVTLGYVLSHLGFSVAVIAGLVSLRLLPETGRVVFGPVIDMSLDARLWFILCAFAAALCLMLYGLVPLRPAMAPVLGAIALVTGVASNCGVVAYSAAIAVTTAPGVRGRIAGWVNAGSLAGTGVGGGLGLWIATHAGGLPTAAFVMGVITAATAWPMFLIRTPRPDVGQPLAVVASDLGQVLFRLIRTRGGVLAILAVTIPAGLGAAMNLMSSVAGDWRASADLVAATTGVLAGLASIPGCLISGYLCDRFPQRSVFACAALICAGAEALMAWGPHTPAAFVVFILLNNFCTGLGYAAVTAIIYDALGQKGGGTVGALLGSLCNVPVVTVTLLIGVMQARHGSSGMLLTEAGLGVVSIAGYSLLAWLWRPGPKISLAPT